jgi:pyruvate dehydrogenase E2 component (dihydrolipoamide acetyltransferase)
VRADLERTLANLGADRDAVSATPQTSNLVPLTGMRGVIAERMVNSLREMAQLTIGADVRADALVAARASLKHAAQLGGPRAPTITDFVVRAVGLSLRVHPRLNATIRDNAIHLIDTINVGIAVALDEGLVVPVISEADQRSIWEISELSRELATKARGSQLTLSELESGTFTVSTLGQFGVDFFTPVISSGQVAILGVGRTREIAAVEHGALVVGQSMTLSLSFDHRAVDGAPAARFLQTVADFLADPLSMA